MLCRVCGNRLLNTGGKSYKSTCKRKYLTSRFSKEILFVFRINVVNDSKDQHSENLCRKCHDMIRFSKSASEATIEKYSKTADMSAHLWVKYCPQKTQSECMSCNHFNEKTYFSKKTRKIGPNDETSSSASTSTDDTSSKSTIEPLSVTSILDPPLPEPPKAPYPSIQEPPPPLSLSSEPANQSHQKCIFWRITCSPF